MTKSPFQRKKNAARLIDERRFIVFAVLNVSKSQALPTSLRFADASTAKIGKPYFFGAHASANFAYFAASAAFFSAFDIVARFA